MRILAVSDEATPEVVLVAFSINRTIQVVKLLPTANRGFASPPRRWLTECSFASMVPIYRQARGDGRLAEALLSPCQRMQLPISGYKVHSGL